MSLITVEAEDHFNEEDKCRFRIILFQNMNFLVVFQTLISVVVQWEE